MKILSFQLIIIFFSFSTYGQQVDYNKIIIPEEVTVTDFGEKLVQMAWKNHPGNQIIIKDYEIAKVSLSQAKWAWLNQINASGNLNEFTINPERNVNNFFLPRYNFGVAIPLGIVVSAPTNAKIAKKELEKADLEIKQQKLFLRNQVLKAYQNYLMYEQIFKLKSDLIEDEYASYLAVEESFENGEVKLSEYKEALMSYTMELENHIKAKNDFENAKLELEMFIGVRLEEII